ncbi:phosphatase [Rothia nasisuis]|uniref:phosphatase n=1 Tax=Rothia nasisuis TaxID=2109647 RepID=UPI001F1CB007|nr:phosphatase [Rothia nasisuis]
MTFSMTRQEFVDYLNASGITGNVATPRENNLAHMQGFVDGNEHLEFGVTWTREWAYTDVFELMARRVGTSADPTHVEGQDTISADLCVDALTAYARVFGRAVRDKKSLLFATGHPAGLFPIYAELARVAAREGATVLTIDEGDRFLEGDIRQIFKVIMFEQFGNLQHTHFSGPMQLALNQLKARGTTPDLVVADHGLAGYAASAGIPTIGIADCNDPGLFVSAEQGHILVAVPMDDNLTPHLYEPVIDFIVHTAGLAPTR